MAVIKISDKQSIDELQAKLILRLGRKISQQETLDLCIHYAAEHFEEIAAKASETPMLSPKKAEEIIARIEKFKDTYYNPHESFPNPEDNDIYSS